MVPERKEVIVVVVVRGLFCGPQKDAALAGPSYVELFVVACGGCVCCVWCGVI